MQTSLCVIKIRLMLLLCDIVAQCVFCVCVVNKVGS